MRDFSTNQNLIDRICYSNERVQERNYFIQLPFFAYDNYGEEYLLIENAILHVLFFCLFLKNPSATFQDRWPQMKRVVLKILRQEPTSQVEWQNLFT